MGLNALVFGGILNVASQGVPYFLFFLCGTTTWILFERSLLAITRSVERNRQLVTKVYFPRLILPIAAVGARHALPGDPARRHGRHRLSCTYNRGGVWYVQLSPRLLASVAAILMSLMFALGGGLLDLGAAGPLP